MPMRALAVADVYEALTAERPYRGAMPVAQALAVVRSDVPGRLDAAVVAALESYLGHMPDPLAPGVATLAAPAPAAPVSGARALGR